MDLTNFKQSVSAKAPPKRLSQAAQALWWDAKGDWDKAHECAQAEDDAEGAWVHAYLHRKEGDAMNAEYWYTRAGRPVFSGEFPAEWREIVTELLAETPG